jgi:hypothetical protein
VVIVVWFPWRMVSTLLAVGRSVVVGPDGVVAVQCALESPGVQACRAPEVRVLQIGAL